MSNKAVFVRIIATDRTMRPFALAHAAAWNASYPVGTIVDYWRGERAGEPSGRGRTYHEATVLGGHTAVVWISGCSGAVALTHVEVVADDAAEREALKAAAIHAGETVAAEARVCEQLDKETNH